MGGGPISTDEVRPQREERVERVFREPPRAESVASLLRPEPVKRMFERAFARHNSHVAGLLSEDERRELAQLDALADEAIAAAVARQIDAGLDVVTDGEMRRAHFVNSLFDAVEGIADNPVVGYFEGDGEVGPPPDPQARERLRIVDNPMAREIQFLRSCTSWPAKVAIPAASNFYMLQYETGAYPSRQDYVAHMGQIISELVLGAIGAGARYIQFDFPLYPALADPEKRADLERELQIDAETLLGRAIAVDNAALDGIPEDVTFGLHICRGNYRSRWSSSGSLEPVAERIFNELPFDASWSSGRTPSVEGDYARCASSPRDRSSRWDSSAPSLRGSRATTANRSRDSTGASPPRPRPARALDAVRLRVRGHGNASPRTTSGASSSWSGGRGPVWGSASR